jgi:hypothetical protein
MTDNYVNGPLNAFRLVGKIDGIEKTVYLFSDCHENISTETTCDSYKSRDFIKYFYETMEQTDKKIQYDYIQETYGNVELFELRKEYDSKNRQNYIASNIEFVKKDTIWDEINNKLTNKGSKTFSNLRLHSFDIRAYLKFSEIKIFLNTISSNFNIDIITKQSINYALFNLIMVKHEVKFMLYLLHLYSTGKGIKYKESISTLNKYVTENFDKECNEYTQNTILPKKQAIEKFFKKIFGEKTKNSVKSKILNSILYKNIFTYAKKLFKIVNKTIKIIQHISDISVEDVYQLNVTIKKLRNRDFVYGNNTYNMHLQFDKLYRNIYKIDDILTNVYVNVTDLYCMWRFLNKDYIQHALIHSGQYHTINYITFLVQECGFELTHTAYSSVSLKEANKMIKESSDESYYKNIFVKPVFKQCVNMKDFPKNFL